MASETQILSRLSPNVVACPSKSQAGVGVPDGACLSQRDHHPQPPILPNLPTIYNLFMQNKPNFREAQMNATIFVRRNYENNSALRLRENKANSKPICIFYRGERRVRRAKEYVCNCLTDKGIQSLSSFSAWLRRSASPRRAIFANSAVNGKQSQFQTGC